MILTSINPWDQRWIAIQTELNQLICQFQEEAADRQPTLIGLTLALQEYANGHLSSSYNTGVRIATQSPYNYQAFQCLHQTIKPITHDVAILQQAHNLRRHIPTGSNRLSLDTLAKSDWLAYKALQPAINAGLLASETTALTYFTEAPRTRVIPYASVALIGIPHTCLYVERDFLAIPHEIGHYIFHRGMYCGENLCDLLFQQAPNQPEWCYHWIEEIFCDIYGCLISGPIATYDFQDLLFATDEEQFVVDDQDHPVPALRPRIYTKVLGKQNHWKHWVSPLDERWDMMVAEMNRGETIHLAGGCRLPIAELISPMPGLNAGYPVDQMITAILGVIEKTGLSKELQLPSLWQEYLADATAIDSFYYIFEESIEKLPVSSAINPPDLPKKAEQIIPPIPSTWTEQGPHGRDQ